MGLRWIRLKSIEAIVRDSTNSNVHYIYLAGNPHSIECWDSDVVEKILQELDRE